MFMFIVFPIYNLFCNVLMTWVSTVYPIYRTMKVIKKQESALYDNYLSFWFLAAIIFAFEWSRLPIVIYPIWFQLKMTAFLLLQWNNCAFSKRIYTRLTPLLNEHEQEFQNAGNRLKVLSTQVKDGMLETVSKQVSKHGPTLLSTGQQFVGDMLTVPEQNNVADVKTDPVQKNVSDAKRRFMEGIVDNDELTIEELKEFRAYQNMLKSATDK